MKLSCLEKYQFIKIILSHAQGKNVINLIADICTEMMNFYHDKSNKPFHRHPGIDSDFIWSCDYCEKATLIMLLAQWVKDGNIFDGFRGFMFEPDLIDWESFQFNLELSEIEVETIQIVNYMALMAKHKKEHGHTGVLVFHVNHEAFDQLEAHGWLNNVFLLGAPIKSAHYSKFLDNRSERITLEVNRLAKVLETDAFDINSFSNETNRPSYITTTENRLKIYRLSKK